MDTGSTEGQVVDLDPGESIKLSCLLGVLGLSPQVGDKVFGSSAFKFKKTDCGPQSNLKPTAISLTALGNDIGSGVSLAGSSPATGNIAENLTIRPLIVPTDPNHLISDVRQSDNDPVCLKGFSSIVERVFTGKSGDGKVRPLDAVNPRDANPVFQDLAYSAPETLQIPTFTPVFSSISPRQSQRP